MSTEVNYSSTTPVYVHGVTPKGLLINANLIVIKQSNYSRTSIIRTRRDLSKKSG